MTNSLEQRLKAIREKKSSVVGENTSSGALEKHEFQESITSLRSVDEGQIFPSAGKERRVMANAILRSSLFGVKRYGNRKYEEKASKFTVAGLTLSVSGWELDQSDLDVFLECINRCSGNQFGTTITFNANDFLESMGWSHGGSGYNWLDEAFDRLMACRISLREGEISFRGVLLEKIHHNEVTHMYELKISSELSSFFSDGHWTGLLMVQRKALGRKQLAQWLHGYYSTHIKPPFPYKVETILKLCNCDTKTMFHFRSSLKTALAELSIVTGWTCWIDKKTDLVHVKKTKAVPHE